jgi:hypothetical protein
MQKKLKAPWVLTDIPKIIKVKLWRLMKDNPAYTSWCMAIARKSGTVDQDEIFAKDEQDFIKMSRDTYNSLKKELMLMPQEEVETLPEDLKRWVLSIRPDLKENLRPSDSRKTLIGEKILESHAANQDPRIIKHFDELCEVSRALHYIQQLLLHEPPSLVSIELLPAFVAKYMLRTVTNQPIFVPPAYFSEHFRQEFPDLNISSWTDLFPEKAIDRLRYLGNTASFKYCPTCQVCMDIAT